MTSAAPVWIACLPLFVIPGAFALPVEISGKYSGPGGEWAGYKPATTPAGGSPVFFSIPGTGDDYWPPLIKQQTYQMALRGFVSVSVKYDNPVHELFTMTTFCEVAAKKADNIFKGAGSALGVVCALPEADCSKGVAVTGHSQGGFITQFSAKSDSRVTAQLPLSTGNFHDPDCGLSFPHKCMNDDRLSPGLPKNKRRYIIGGHDSVAGGTPELALKSSKEMSGYDCGKKFDCIQSDGSGYYVIQASEHAGTCEVSPHTFHMDGPNPKPGVKFLCDFLGAKKWALKANLDWLASAAMTSGSPPSVALSFEGGDIPCTEACPLPDDDTTALCLLLNYWWAFLLGALLLVCCCIGCCVGCYLKSASVASSPPRQQR